VKRLFWGVLAAMELVACGANPAGPRAEPSGRSSIQPVPEPAGSKPPRALAPAGGGSPAPTEARGSGPATRCCPSAEEGRAVVRCDPDRIVPAGPLLFHPDRPTPPAAQRATLDAVADLMHRRQEILLLRIEVSSHRPAPDAARQRRAIQEAQRRADALFGYLWRRRGVSAERMEAVGLSAPTQADTEGGWSTELRILQWAPPSGGEASGSHADAACDQAASP